MLLFLPPLVAIPIHGAVQLVANGSRSFTQRRHLRWDIIWRYAILLLPMGFVGLAIAERLPADLSKTLIGVFVLVATWAPGLLFLGTHPEDANPHRRFFVLGGVAGLLNVTLGAIGPLLAPFYLNLGMTRFELIGTKAASQALGHVAKIVVFGAAGFAFSEWLPVLAALAVCSVIGTWIGSWILDRVSEIWFVRIYKTVLTAISIRLAVSSAWPD
jgi:uncharacterized membrane protein YfcA